ncbi:MAG: VOC family protein [Pseudomonadota bacterium]
MRNLREARITDKPESERGFTVSALGEIAIRCSDFEGMTAFYRDVVGLSVLPGGYSDGIVFFDLGPGYGGHTSVLALFRHDAGRADLHPQDGQPVSGARSSLHHIALTVDAAEQKAVIAWYERLGLDYRVEDFDWIGWRGVFTTDPEGNTVELVAKLRPPAT